MPNANTELTEILSKSDFVSDKLAYIEICISTKPFVSDIGHGKNLDQFTVAKSLDWSFMLKILF